MEDAAPIALRFEPSPQDFVVEEIPAFEPSGSGEHLFVEIEKERLSTPALARAAAREFELAARDVGYAGRKDAQARTRQWISLRGVAASHAQRLESPRVHVLRVARHERKLRLGQLAGNRFELVLRGIGAPDRERLERRLATLARRGLPNSFGPQRFGVRGAAAQLGRLLLAGRPRDYLLALTSPEHAPPHPHLAQLHDAIAEGSRAGLRRLSSLAPRLPRELGELARQLARRRGDWHSALRALERSTLYFHLSAWQSRVFNRVLAERRAGFDQVQLGDLARRAAAFEISPTGPLPGSRMPFASGAVGELEARALGAEGGGPGGEAACEKLPSWLSLPGARRSLRARVEDLRWSWREDVLTLGLRLPPGSYATVLVDELRGAGEYSLDRCRPRP